MTIEDPASNGIIITYMLTLGGTTAGILYTMSNLSKMAVSIQRLRDYAKWKDHEKSFDEPKPEKKNWPENGKIEMKNLTVRYRRGLPLVLDHVNFSIKSGQNVAIVGRTGSGKSTILLALMRILEMAEEGDEKFKNENNEADGEKLEPGSGVPLGHISIDGQRIEKIGLHHLRSILAIIPQDPFLLEGTLKFNIDPFNKYSEDEIINVLNSVKIFDSIRDEDIIDQKIKEIKDRTPMPKKKLNKEQLKKRSDKIEKDLSEDPELKRLKESGPKITDKLEYGIEANGGNLSLGQRQLICIARALIMNPKILLMDEATANIDQKTDSIIQTVIKEKLKETTVITIAHRLITIVQYDNILVLEDGKKKEEGAPVDLMKDNSSYFRKLVMEGGQEFFEKMVYAAENKDEDVAKIFA